MSRDAQAALIRALLARGGEGCHLLDASGRGWASMTFDGTRHVVDLAVPADRAGLFVEGIEEADFDLRGHLVADLAIVARAPMETGVVHLRIEALTLVDPGSRPERTARNPRLRDHG